MSTVMTNLKKWEDQYFTLVKRIETPVVRYTGEMAETLVKYVPARPRFMTGMPKVNEVVDNGLEFRRRMVNEQAAFTRKMMKAMDPVLVKFETAPKAHKPEHKPVHMTQPVTRMAPRKVTRKVA